MKNIALRLITLCLCLFAFRASATTYYVNINNPNPTSPYTTWDTAATNIQDAVDAANPGDQILVSNGLYSTGGRIAYGTQSNRLAVTKPVTIQSVNGPLVTTIQGNPVNDDTAVRCVYLTNNATLIGFTLTAGATSLNDNGEGAGVYCESASATVSNCVLTGNSAVSAGGGAYGGTLNNCVLSNNWVTYFYFYGAGGGACDSTLNNCLLEYNSAGYGAGGADTATANNCTFIDNSSGFEGGGADYATLNNCIVYYNSSTWNSGNYGNCTLNDCCTTPLPDTGSNNITREPVFVNLAGNDFHLQSNSPCINLGDNSFAFGGSDLDGNPRIVGNAVDIGAYEFQTAIPLTVAITADFTNVAPGNLLNFMGRVFDGRVTSSVWDFGDGTTVSNQLCVSHSWTTVGNYPVVFEVYADGYSDVISATVTVHVVTQPVLYVSQACTNPVPPYLTWDTAATNIQDAVDAATVVGSVVVVSNGVYQIGGRVVYGSQSNRVAVTMPMTVQSVNGPAVTVIQGYQVTNTITGDDAVRCVYLTSSATLTGFTLTGGATRSAGDPVQEQSGAGVWCGPTNVNVSNCVLYANSANSTGGGAYQGTFNNCIFTSNSVPGGSGGAVEAGTLNDCSLIGNSAPYNGGAADNCALINCIVTGNQAGIAGGGLNACTASNCVMTGNSADSSGGAAENGTLENCTLTGNSANYGGAADAGTLSFCVLSNNVALSYGGGANNSALSNCTFAANSAANYGGGVNGSTLNNCLLTGNVSTYGGGVEGCNLNQCALTANTADENGGGADGSTLDNCTLSGNSAVADGGGVDNSSLNNCSVTGNSSADAGGGAENSTLNNCTLTGNFAVIGGGADSSTLNNCIAFYNSAPGQPNYSASTLNYCCTTPLPNNGTNDIIADPQLIDSAHISANSPCIGAGSSNYSSGVDLDGEPWLNPPSIGCNEYNAGTAEGPLNVQLQASYTNVAAGFTVNFTGVIVGHASMDVWDFGDGTVVTNYLAIAHSWPSPGTYPVTLTVYNDDNPNGVSATVFVQVLEQPVSYVSVNSANPVPPYLTWDTAATNIQDAIDAVYAGGVVWVSNGVYQTGSRADYSTDTNRVIVSKPLTIQSVNGPLVTTIDGGGLMRCVNMVGGAMLIGFTMTNGLASGDGGGVLCESSAVCLSNCVLTANSAGDSGGGAYGGALNNCTLAGNTAGNAGGGVCGGTLAHCTLANNYGYFGGGAESSALVDCVLTANISYYGGGAENSTLLDCTLDGNFTYIDSDYTANGGGASACSLTNCVISENSSLTGAGASGSTLVNCALTGNSTEIGDGVWPPTGGGAYGSTLVNCTVAGNSAISTGGGVSSCALTNCIVYFNTAPDGTNYSDDSTLSYCDSTPLPAIGTNDITGHPSFVDWTNGDFQLQSNSPCINLGDNACVTTSTDLAGNPRIVGGAVDIGAYEYQTPIPLTVAIGADNTNVATGFPLQLQAIVGQGFATAVLWNFGDGTSSTNQLAVAHSWLSPGVYTVTVTVSNDFVPAPASASLTIYVATEPVTYVNASGTNPVPPYSSWNTSATNIQDAVNAAYDGGTVWVTNGIYQYGGETIDGYGLTNRVAIDKPVIVQSVNGPAATVILGYQDPNTIVAADSIRCVYMAGGAVLSGFTLTDGATLDGGDGNFEQSGGGIFCESTNAVVASCVIINNSANNNGGGANQGTFNDCIFIGNAAENDGGGANDSVLNNCVLTNNIAETVFPPAILKAAVRSNGAGNPIPLFIVSSAGGGAEGGELNNCILTGNSAQVGGGVDSGTANNCLILDNTADLGGAANGSVLNNCTLVGNIGSNDGAAADFSTLNNCIEFFNSGPDGYTAYNYCCSDQNPGGIGNITNDPAFVNWQNNDFHLTANSPCINSGNNLYVTTTNDFDGKPRIVGGTVDIGAYEYQTPTSVISYAYLQQFGLPTDGSADFADLDGTAFNVYQDWIAGLNPTNSASVLAMLTPVTTNSPTGVTVTWQSVSGIPYFLQRSTNLVSRPLFSIVETNIIGQSNTTSYTDTTATNNVPYFYRVGVIAP